MDQSQFVEALVAKFPSFDPLWDAFSQDLWFAGMQRMLDMLAPAAPVVVSVPGGTPVAAADPPDTPAAPGPAQDLRHHAIKRTDAEKAALAAEVGRLLDAGYSKAGVIKTLHIGVLTMKEMCAFRAAATKPVPPRPEPLPVAHVAAGNGHVPHAIAPGLLQEMIRLAEGGATDAEIGEEMELSSLTVRAALKLWRKEH